jgi:hypothetical protein
VHIFSWIDGKLAQKMHKKPQGIVWDGNGSFA